RPHRPVAIYAAPEGHDALVLASLAADTAREILHICTDDGRMARLAAAIAFFAPDLEVLTFPAWDCLPYDRSSPNSEIVSRRVDTLTRLADLDAEPEARRIVLTTINALVQRVPPRTVFRGRVLSVRVGGRISLDRLISFFSQNGYARTDTVREAGEYAVRGGIAYVFPSGELSPLRLDFFGDTLEGVR